MRIGDHTMTGATRLSTKKRRGWRASLSTLAREHTVPVIVGPLLVAILVAWLTRVGLVPGSDNGQRSIGGPPSVAQSTSASPTKPPVPAPAGALFAVVSVDADPVDLRDDGAAVDGVLARVPVTMPSRVRWRSIELGPDLLATR